MGCPRQSIAELAADEVSSQRLSDTQCFRHTISILVAACSVAVVSDNRRLNRPSDLSLPRISDWSLLEPVFQNGQFSEWPDYRR